MPKDKVLKSKVALKALEDGKMTLYQFKSWAIDKFGEKLGEKVYQNAVRLKKGIDKKKADYAPATAYEAGASLRKRGKKLSLSEILEKQREIKKKLKEKKK